MEDSTRNKKNLKNILEDIEKNPEILDEMTEDEIRELRKEIHPYSNVVGLGDKYTILSFTNIDAEFNKRLITMGVAGFVYKMLEEFNPEDHPQLDELYPEEDKDKLPFTVEKIKGFLDTIFNYNPEDHVRPLKRENASSLNELTAQKQKELNIPMPPADTMLRFTRYLDNHFEQLRDITARAWGIDSAIEDAIQVMETFNTEDEAKAFREKYQDDFRCQVRVLQHGVWNLVGPWEKNRDKMEYLNEQTQFLQEVMDRLEEDERLGAEMMRKRVKKKKTRNIEKDGNDPKTLDQYAGLTGKRLDKLGASRVELTEAELAKAQAKAARKKARGKTETVAQDPDPEQEQEQDDKYINMSEDDGECPDDAVEVNVIEISKGGKQVKKSKFYTEADSQDQVRKQAAEIEKVRPNPQTTDTPKEQRKAQTRSRGKGPRLASEAAEYEKSVKAKSGKMTLG